MEINHATTEDARAVALLHVSAWQAAYKGIVPAEYLAAQSVDKRESYWSEAIRVASPELLVAKVDGQVVGWVAFGPCRDVGATSSTAEVWAIYVAPTHWSQGVGKALWLNARARMVEQGFLGVSLWVLAENHRAIRFYLVAGFMPEVSSTKEVIMAGKPLHEVRYVAAIDG